MKTKSEKIIKLLKKEKTQKILSYLNGKTDTWIQYSELRKEFVRKYSNVKKHPYDFYVDPETMEKYNFRPKSLYNEDSQFSRDLKELVDYGILENKKIPQKKGKPKSYYRPKKEFKNESKNEGLRLQNKKALDLFPSKKIIDFNIMEKNIYNEEYIDKKVILYGLSRELLKNMPDEKKYIDKLLIKLDQTFKKIINKKSELWEKENKKRLNHFLKKTKNNRIKKVLVDQDIEVLGNFSFFVDGSKYENQRSHNTKKVDVTKSKALFILQFKYGTSISIGGRTTRIKSYSDIFTFKNDNTFMDFIRYVDNLSDKEYCKLWCKTFFHKEYNLTRKDIYEIIEWVWDNRDFFDMFFPMDLALSAYGSRESNKLIDL